MLCFKRLYKDTYNALYIRTSWKVFPFFLYTFYCNKTNQWPISLCRCAPCGLLRPRSDLPAVEPGARPVAGWTSPRCQRLRHPPRGPELPLPGPRDGRLPGGPGAAARAGQVLPRRQRRGHALLLGRGRRLTTPGWLSGRTGLRPGLPALRDGLHALKMFWLVRAPGLEGQKDFTDGSKLLDRRNHVFKSTQTCRIAEVKDVASWDCMDWAHLREWL